MSVYGTGLDIGQFRVSIDYVAYTFGVINSGKISLPKAGQYADGVVMQSANADDNVELRYAGTSKILCASAIPDASFISTDANGNAVAATQGQYILGKALESGVQGQYIEIILMTIAPNVPADVVSKSQFNQTLISSCSDNLVKAAIKTAATS